MFNSNKFYSALLIKKLTDLYMPTLPLWCSVMLGDLSRHSVNNDVLRAEKFFNIVSKCTSSDSFGRTTGSQEQRFTVLKNLCLQGKKCARIDDFTVLLHEHFLATEKYFVLSYLSKYKSAANKVTSDILEEQWNKRSTQSAVLHNPKLGKYQQALQKGVNNLNDVNSKRKTSTTSVSSCKRSRKQNVEIAVAPAGLAVDKRFCSMLNFGNTCWLNSLLQALNYTHAITNVLCECDAVIAVDDAVTSISSAFSKSWLFKVMMHLRTKAPTAVDRQMLLNLSTDRFLKLCKFQFDLNVQCDSFDFLDKAIFPVIKDLGFCPVSLTRITCSKCEARLAENAAEHHAIFLEVPEHYSCKLSMQSLVDTAAAACEVVSGKCTSITCQDTDQSLMGCSIFTSLPDSVVFVLKRQLSNNTSIKNESFVHLNDWLSIEKHDIFEGEPEVLNYRLRSFVAHCGQTFDNGHYYAGVFTNSSNKIEWTVCNDESIYIEEMKVPGRINEMHCQQAHLMFYDRVKCKDDNFQILFKLLQKSNGMLSYERIFSDKDAFNSRLNGSIISRILQAQHGSDLLCDMSLSLPTKCKSVSCCAMFLKKLLAGFQCPDVVRYSAFHMQILAKDDNGSLFSLTSCVLSLEMSFCEDAIRIACQNSSQLEECHFFSFPNTLVVNFSDIPSILVPSKLDLSVFLNKIYPFNTIVYTLVGMAFCSPGGQLLEKPYEGPDSNTVHRHLVKRGLAFYNVSNESNCVHGLRKANVCIFTTPVMVMESVDSEAIKKQIVWYDGICLSEAQWECIFSENWFSGDIVDSYMLLLSKKIDKKIFIGNCAWTGNYLFVNQELKRPIRNLLKLEKKGDYWFDDDGKPVYDYALLPMSIYNKHYVLIVISFNGRGIFVCDPEGIERPNLLHQAARLPSSQFFRATFCTIPIHEWKYCYYSPSHFGIPNQTDTHSCGPYVCMLAKCILFAKNLNSVDRSQYRPIIAYELSNNTVL